MIYISQNFSYNYRKDLQISCPKELESVFIEVLVPKKKSHLTGVAYKHSSLNHKFNNNFLNTVLEKLTLENKLCITTGDFNLNLNKYMQNIGVNQFLEKEISQSVPNNIIPQITPPTRITEKTATLTDNIFQNSYTHNSNCVSGNTTT